MLRSYRPGQARTGQALVYLVFVGLLALTASGLALDVGRLLLERQAALNLADTAAHSGAQQIDTRHFRQTGEIRLLTSTRSTTTPGAGEQTAEAAAGRLLAAAGYPPCHTEHETCASIRIVPGTGPTSVEAIEVSVRQRVTLILLRREDLANSTIVIEGTSSATPRVVRP